MSGVSTVAARAVVDPSRPPPADDHGRPEFQLSQRDPIGGARFAPGHLFAGRYRIVMLLGRGATGEVYRADDLRVGRPVALKLLAIPSARATHVQRFVKEVRLARDIAHPNICRVYDIDHADGWHYLSMEYVDGETLASLLRRIGAMPREKALDIARQLCAGLAAAHRAGVVHRDIKPSNIMIDGSGVVRLTDFGLAVSTGEAHEGEVAGTPAYMAPEQLEGDPVTERTDLYALGLVLYELFTGRRLFPAHSIDERFPIDADRPLPLREVEPAVADIIRRCLERNPAARPAAALAIAAALPGEDALAAARAEGRLLSPDVIAAAGPTGELRSGIAWCLFGLVVAGSLAVASQIGSVTRIQPATIPKPPEALVEHVRQILGTVDDRHTRGDSDYWFRAARDGANPPPNSPISAIHFVYRESASYLVPQNLFHLVSEVDPSPRLPGMTSVTTDAAGLLLRFETVPLGAPTASAGTIPDWARFFEATGLRLSEFTEVTPDRAAPVPFDQQRHWIRADGAFGIRVAAASLGGQPVYFERLPGSPLTYTTRTAFSTGRAVSVDAWVWAWITAAFLLASVLARYNLRRGEGDRRTANRVSLFVISGGILTGILRAHHVPVGVDEVAFELGSIGWSVVWGAFTWLTYVGLEPHVRRVWPEALVSWTRFVSGRVRDPLVGRDVLLGALASVTVLVTTILIGGAPTTINPTLVLEAFRSTRQFAAMLGFNTLDSLQYALAGLFLLLLMRKLLRKTWIAVLVLATLFLPISTGGAWQTSLIAIISALLFSLVGLTLLVRVGLLSFVAMGCVNRLLTAFPLTLDVSAWYFGSVVVVLLVIGAIAAYGCAVAMGLPARRAEALIA